MQVDHFKEMGFLAIEELTTAEDVARITDILSRLYSRFTQLPGAYAKDLGDQARPDGQPQIPEINWTLRLAPQLRSTAAFRRAHALAEQLLGCRVEHTGYDHAILKPAHNGRATPWHQDAAYTKDRGPFGTVHIWIALQDVTIESGCMQFIPRSHLGPMLPHHRRNHCHTAHVLQVDDVDASMAVACPLRAGGATAHLPRTLHYTGPNLSDQPRFAWSLEFAPVRRRLWPSFGHEFRRQLSKRYALVSRSMSLFLRPVVDTRQLEQSVRQKYSDPLELEAHRHEAIAGPTRLQQQFLDGHVTARSTVLDVGCAAGRISLAVSRAGSRVVAIDVCDSMVREGRDLARRQSLPARFCAMDARALGFPDGSFDTVLMFGSVLSYIAGWEARLEALREAYRVLKPNGQLLIETQSRTSGRVYRVFFAAMSCAHCVLERLGRRPAWQVGDRLGLSVSAAESETLVYFHMYSPDELARDLERVGFEPVPVDTSLYLIHYVGLKRA